MDSPHEDRSSRTVLIVFLAALFVRLVYLIEFSDSVFFSSPILDAASHDEMARRIVSGKLLDGAPYFRAPLYSWFLALCYGAGGTSPWAPRLVQAVLGALAAAVLAGTAGRLLGRRAGLATGLIFAFYGPLVFSTGELLHEALLVPCLVISLFLFVKGQAELDDEDSGSGPWFLGGLVLGLSAITRPSALVLLPAAVIAPFVLSRPARMSGRARRLIVPILAGVALPILPVTAINYVSSGDFVLIASQGGINFYAGNNAGADGRHVAVPELGDDASWGDFVPLVTARAEEGAGRRLRPSEVSDYWMKRGLDWLGGHPAAAFRLYLAKTAALLSGYEVPNNRDIYVARRDSFLLSVLVGPGPLFHPWGLLLPLAVLGFLLAPRRPLMLFWSFAVSYALFLLPFFIADRFRLPLVTWMAPFAAYGLVSIPDVVRNPRAALKPLLAATLALVLANLTWGADSRGNPADSWHKLGEALYNRGDYQPALEAFSRALELDPENDLLRLARAHALEAVGADSLAAGEFKAASRLTDSWQAQFGYGRFLLKEGRAAEAVPYLERAAGLMPERAELHRELGFAYELSGNFGAAGLALAHALRLGEESADLHLSLGIAALNQGGVQVAETNWRRALELDPRHFRSLYNLGLLKFSQGDLGEAEDLWARAAAVKPDDPLPHLQLARVAARSGNLARAAEEVGAARRLGLPADQVRMDPLLRDVPVRISPESGLP